MKILTLYFSKTGHTKAAAELIHETAGGDIYEIKTERTYSDSYGVAVLQSGLERFRNSLPELKDIPDISAYDTIFIGSPVWWFTLAPAVKALIAETDWKGKTVYPFFTSGGQPRHTGDDFTALLKKAGADIPDYFHIPYKGNKVEKEPAEIVGWTERKLEGRS